MNLSLACLNLWLNYINLSVGLLLHVPASVVIYQHLITIFTMSPFQNLSSPPPAYINNTLNDNTGTAVLLEPVAQQQRLCSSINPRSTHMHPDEHSILTSSTVGNQNLVDIESRVSAAGSSCAVAAFTEFKQDKLVSKLEEVLRALEKKDEKSSPEDKLISRLENAIRHIGDASISEGKRDIRKPIKFKDAVGRRFSFPYHRCETWAVSTSVNHFPTWYWYPDRALKNLSNKHFFMLKSLVLMSRRVTTIWWTRQVKLFFRRSGKIMLNLDGLSLCRCGLCPIQYRDHHHRLFMLSWIEAHHRLFRHFTRDLQWTLTLPVAVESTHPMLTCLRRKRKAFEDYGVK